MRIRYVAALGLAGLAISYIDKSSVEALVTIFGCGLLHGQRSVEGKLNDLKLGFLADRPSDALIRDLWKQAHPPRPPKPQA